MPSTPNSHWALKSLFGIFVLYLLIFVALQVAALRASRTVIEPPAKDDTTEDIAPLFNDTPAIPQLPMDAPVVIAPHARIGVAVHAFDYLGGTVFFADPDYPTSHEAEPALLEATAAALGQKGFDGIALPNSRLADIDATQKRQPDGGPLTPHHGERCPDHTAHRSTYLAGIEEDVHVDNLLLVQEEFSDTIASSWSLLGAQSHGNALVQLDAALYSHDGCLLWRSSSKVTSHLAHDGLLTDWKHAAPSLAETRRAAAQRMVENLAASAHH